MRALVGELGIADRVEPAPWLDDDQFVAYFAECTLTVFLRPTSGLPRRSPTRCGCAIRSSSTDEALRPSPARAPVAQRIRRRWLRR